MSKEEIAQASESSNGRITELIHYISEDMKTIAGDEIELVRGEISHSAKSAIAEASVALLGAVVGLIGLGLLCVAAVVALAPVIPPLWARLLIFAGVYIVVGGLVAALFGRRIGRDAAPSLDVPKFEAKRTIAGAKAALASS